MSLVELLPTVRSLSRQDKLRLIQVLAEEMSEEKDHLPSPRVGLTLSGPRIELAERRPRCFASWKRIKVCRESGLQGICFR